MEKTPAYPNENFSSIVRNDKILQNFFHFGGISQEKPFSDQLLFCGDQKKIEFLISINNIRKYIIINYFYQDPYLQFFKAEQLFPFLVILYQLDNAVVNPNHNYQMISKSTLITSLLFVVTLFAASYFNYTSFSSNNLKFQNPSNNLAVTFKSISSILRTTLNRVFVSNNTVYVGDNVGSVAIWTFDPKKKKLQFQDISRQIAAVLPPQNKVVHVQATNGAVGVLTIDGKISSYLVNAQNKITSNEKIILEESISWFTLAHFQRNISQSNIVSKNMIATVNKNKNQLCLYQFQSLAHPNPLKKISCNTTSSNLTSYDHVSFDSVNSLLSVGDENRAIVFAINSTQQGKLQMRYIAEANLPKVQTKGFKSVFVNGTLLAINDLWINSILIDLATPSVRVVSAERTEKIIKSGETSEISAVLDPKLKKSLAIINSKNRIQSFSVANSKLTYVNDSRTVGRSENFMLGDETQLFTTSQVQLQVYKIGDTQQKDYLTLEDEYPVQSANHFKSVLSMSLSNTTFISVSQGSKYNVKLWNYSNSDYKLHLMDQKSISFFSLLKSGYVSFYSSLMIPPPAKSTTLHVAVAGSDPFGIYILPISSQGKLGSIFRSKDQHSGNITTLMLSSDKKQIISGSMDTTIKIWTLNANHDQVQDNTTTIVTKNGPIRFGVQDKTGTYFAFGHNNNIFNKLVNISIWKSDPKHGLVKLAQNVPDQAHETNLTSLILTHDQKYLVSLSESGQLRLWRLENWTMVDLMGSLALGIFDAKIQGTQTNKLLVESQKFFAQYYYDQNGFILLGRSTKAFSSNINSTLAVGNTWFSGDKDGSIRIYTYEE